MLSIKYIILAYTIDGRRSLGFSSLSHRLLSSHGRWPEAAFSNFLYHEFVYSKWYAEWKSSFSRWLPAAAKTVQIFILYRQLCQ